MDFSKLLGTIITNAWFLIPLAVFAFVIKAAWFKGVAGEFLVNVFAKIFLNKQDYHLIKNVTLPTEDGTLLLGQITQAVITLAATIADECDCRRGISCSSVVEAPCELHLQKNFFEFPYTK